MTDAWWVIHSEELRTALLRCHQGENPELVYLELWANSEHEPGEADAAEDDRQEEGQHPTRPFGNEPDDPEDGEKETD